MGQKINPVGLRIGVKMNSQSAEKRKAQLRRAIYDSIGVDYGSELNESHRIEELLKEVIEKKGFLLGRYFMERYSQKIEVNMDVFSGDSKKGEKLEKALVFLSKYLEDKVTKGVSVVWKVRELKVEESLVKEYRNSIKLRRWRREEYFEEGIRVFSVGTESAQLMASYIAKGSKGGKRFWEFVAEGMSLMALKGCMFKVKGRLEGSERKSEFKYRRGAMPLQTLTAKIDYGFAVIEGLCSIKVWFAYGEARKGK